MSRREPTSPPTESALIPDDDVDHVEVNLEPTDSVKRRPETKLERGVIVSHLTDVEGNRICDALITLGETEAAMGGDLITRLTALRLRHPDTGVENGGAGGARTSNRCEDGGA